MPSAIKASPNTYDFGYEFNYANWTEGTVLTLVNVPWNSDYRDIVRFASKTARDSWIDSKPNLTIGDVSLGKFQQNVRVATPLTAAQKYNYLRASNPNTPVSGDQAQKYYYFILDVRYIAPNNTELVLQLDIWQTFGFDVSFGQCFVERGHIGIANENQFDHYGRDYLDEPEGLDIGSEYRVVHVESEKITDTSTADILVVSSVDLTAPPGTVDNPQLTAAAGGTFQGMPSGASFYYFKRPSQFVAFLKNLQDSPWITQGILSITAIPPINRYYPSWVDYQNTALDLTAGDYDRPDAIIIYDVPKTAPSTKITGMHTDWRNSDFITAVLGPRYAGLKKFLTSPYTIIEMTTFTGSPIVLKPEHWQDADATVRELAAFVPPGQRLVFAPNHYNTQSGAGGDTFAQDDMGEWINLAVTLDNFPSLPIVNNMAINFLAANKNGLAFQFATAEWGQARANRGGDVSYMQAQGAMRLATELTGISNTANAFQATSAGAFGQAQAGVSGAGGVVSGFAAGGPVGAAAGAVGGVTGQANAALSAAQMQVSAQISNEAARQSTAARNRQAGMVADTNFNLQRFASKGDYENAVAGVHAKIQDSRMLQPSTNGQFGGDSFNLINGAFGYSLRWKMLNQKALRAIGDYWLRYGYRVSQFVSFPSSFMCMSKFTYWKLQETYISQAPIPESFKQTIRGIFEKGVTVWADPEYIGVTDWADNEPLAGVSY